MDKKTKKPVQTADEKILEEALERFKKSVDAEAADRVDYLDDYRFARLGEQWDDTIRRDRELEGRPCLTINRMPSFIRQVVNDARQNTPQIKVSAMDGGADPETAEVMGDLIKAIEIQSNADAAYDTALDCAVSGGFGYFRIDIDYTHDDGFDLQINVVRVPNPLTVYRDADSMGIDASDWRYAFVTDFINRDDFEARYKGAEQVDWETYGVGMDQEWLTEDKIRVAEYWDKTEKADKMVKLSSGIVLLEADYEANRELFDISGDVVVTERDIRTYKITHYIMTGSEILERKDWPGQYIPICPVFGDELVVDGKRSFQSLIRQAKDPQRMFNYWRTASTELVALAPKTPFIGPEGAFDTDTQKWQTANTKSHAFITYSGQTPPQRQAFAGPPAGALQEAMNASEDIKSVLGLFDASLGAKSNETSGRAILARQREGDVSTFHFIDNLSRAIRYAGVVLVDLIPHVYNEERVVRVIGQDGASRQVTINQQPPQPGMENPQEENSEIKSIFNLTAGKYDVVVAAGPSFTSRREEAATQMTELLKVFPQAAPLITDIVAKNMDWPGADQIAKRLQTMLPPAIQKMESNGQIPPQAQAIISGMEQQAQQAQQQMQQMGQQMQQMQQATEKAISDMQKMRVELANKDKEFQLRQYEIRTTTDKDIQLAHMKGDQDQKDIALKAYFDEKQTHLDAKLEMFQQAMQQMALAQQPQQPPQITIQNGEKGGKKRSPKRRMSIVAPSGQIYQGMVEDVEDPADQAGDTTEA